MVQKP